MSMKSGFKRCWHPIGLVTPGQPFGRMNVLHDMSQSNTGTSPVTEHKMYCEKNYYVQTSKDKRAMLIEKNPFSSCSIILLYVHRVKILLWLVLLSYLLNLTCVRMTEILYKVNYCSSCTLTSVFLMWCCLPIAIGICIEHQCTGVNFITAVMSCPNPV